MTPENKANKYGGEDKREKPTKEPCSANKWDHWQRSVHSQPNHLKVEKKIQKPSH
jgi:hypothetical protein